MVPCLLQLVEQGKAKAFQGAKHALTSSPVLVLPDYSKPFEVVCDASLTGIGAVPGGQACCI